MVYCNGESYDIPQGIARLHTHANEYTHYMYSKSVATDIKPSYECQQVFHYKDYVS